MDKQIEPLWPQLLRYAIALGGTVLATRGALDPSDVQSLASSVEMIVGGAATVGAIGYRVATWAKAQRKVKKAKG